jgi:nitroimidazol reductase NimA-like FMN-containing flavoprotein (pyridoxamine 5'-phosphate oxidase superfamily)
MTPTPPTDDQPVVELDVEECWSLLGAGHNGRLAYRLVDEVHLVPVSYTLDERRILIRTAPGSKLLAAELGAAAAFEIDWFGEKEAWSVVASGHMRHLDEQEEHRLEDLHVQSATPTAKYEAVELTPESVSGRRFLVVRRPE